MQAKLKYEFIDCWNKSLERTLHKEETQDCVVPDTMPDASRILYTQGSLLIRSKDVAAGKLKLEANIPTRVVFRDEDGGVSVVDVNVPVYMSAEDDSLGEDSFCTADMKLTSLEARLLNPRKVLVRAEVSAKVCGYNKAQISYSVGVEDAEHIHTRQQPGELSFVSAVGEKTFALSDEQALPPGLEDGEILCSAVELFADDVKQLGSKLILKGRVKSRLLLRHSSGICPLEATTDFSQIVECTGADNAAVDLCITPSGAHHYISSESGEARLCMEFHIVAQLRCSETKTVICLTDAYSNCFDLDCKRRDCLCERLLPRPFQRSSARQLYEVKSVADIISCSHIWGSPKSAGEKLCLPLAVQCLYADEDGELRSEKLTTEICFDGDSQQNCITAMKSIELSECAVATLPGGIELRVSAQTELVSVSRDSFFCLEEISYDEEKTEDISRKPSIVLLRANSGQDLWTLARENCSTVEAIIEANHLENEEGAWEKLLLIPKSL